MNTVKSILMHIFNIISIPCAIFLAFCTGWYLLPAIDTSILGVEILNILSAKAIFWLFIASAFLYIVFIILKIIFNKCLSAKVSNFYCHLRTWLFCIVLFLLTVATFIVVNPLITEGISIGIPKKIFIGLDIFVLILFHIFSGKINKLINRKIQAYDNAKELNAVGRSSIVWVNFLKLFEIVFPEMLVIFLLCLMLSWDVAAFFTLLLISFIVPMIGNIICDLYTRTEIVKTNKEKHDKLVDDIAQKVKNDGGIK